MGTVNKAKYWMAVVAFCLVATTGYFFSTASNPDLSASFSEQSTSAHPSSFRDSLDRPIRLYIWGLPNSVKIQLQGLDIDGDIDWDFDSSVLADYDMAVVFVNEWDEMLSIPFSSDVFYTPDFLQARREENPLFDEAVIVNSLLLADEILREKFFLEVFNATNLRKLGDDCFPNFIYRQVIYPSTNDKALNDESNQYCEEYQHGM